MADFYFEDDAPAAPAAAAGDGEVSWGDYGKAFTSGLASTGANVLRSVESEKSPAFLKDARRSLETSAAETAAGLSPAARKDMSREVLSTGENSVWVRPSAIPLQMTGSVLPSMAATAGAAALGAPLGAAGVLGGMAAAGYGMVAGEVEKSVEDVLKTAPAKQLGPRFAKLRSEGRSDLEAREQLAREVASGYSQGAGAFSGVLNTLGPVSGLIRGMVSKQGAKAFAARTIKGAVGKEAVLEGVDEAATEGAGQAALLDKYGVPLKPGEIAEASAKGVVMGAGTGGAARVLSGRPKVTDDRGSVVDDAQQDALRAGVPAQDETGPVDRSIGATADRIADQARAVAEAQRAAIPTEPQAPQPAIPDAQPGPVAPQQAIPTEGPDPYMQGRREQMLAGDDTNTRDVAGPLPTQDPFGDRRAAMRPDSQTQPAPANQPPDTRVLRQLEFFANSNNGVLDPLQIAADYSQRGISTTPQQIVQQLAPLVQQGVLQQRTIPGSRGQPLFRLIPQRPAGSAAVTQGPQQATRAPAIATTPGYAPDATVDQSWETAAQFGTDPDAQLARGWERSVGYDPDAVPRAQPGPVAAPAAAAPAQKKKASGGSSGGGAGTTPAAPVGTNQPQRAVAAKQASKARSNRPTKSGTPGEKALAVVAQTQPAKPAAVAAPVAETVSAPVREKAAKPARKPRVEAKAAEPAPAPAAEPAPVQAPAKKTRAAKIKLKVKERAALTASKGAAPVKAAKYTLEARRQRAETAQVVAKRGSTPPAFDDTGMIPARLNLPPDRQPRPKPAPEPVQRPPLKRQSADALKERLLAAAPKAADGKADLGVVNGVIRTVYNDGVAPQDGQSVSLVDWYDELTPVERQRAVAIVEGWRDQYGPRLDTKGRRPIVPWLRSDEKIAERATSGLNARKAQEKAERPARPRMVSDRALAEEVQRQFAVDVEQGDGHVDALVGSIMRDAREEMDAEGFDGIDYPGLLDTARSRMAKIPAERRPAAVDALKRAAASVLSGEKTIRAAVADATDVAVENANPIPIDGDLAAARAAAAEQLAPVDAAEDAARKAEADARQEKARERAMKDTGLTAAGSKVRTSRDKSRVEFFQFTREDGELRPFSTIRRVGETIADVYRASGKELPPVIEQITTYNALTKGKTGNATRTPDLIAMREEIERLAPSWDGEAAARLQDRREDFKASTPERIVQEFAAKDVETPQQSLDRIAEMAATFDARQQVSRNRKNVTALIETRNNPYTRFLREIRRLTDRGNKPLVYETDGQARRAVLYGDLTEAELAKLKTMLDKRKGNQMAVPADVERRIVSRFRAKIRKNPKVNARDTYEWQTIRDNVERDMSRAGEPLDDPAKIDREADKLFKAQHPNFKDTLLGSGRGMQAALDARIRRAQAVRALLAQDALIRIEDAGQWSSDALGPVLERRSNPFTEYRDYVGLGDAGRPGALESGTYDVDETLDIMFPAGVDDRNAYGPFSQLAQLLSRRLAGSDLLVRVATPEQMLASGRSERTLGVFSPSLNAVFVRSGQTMAEAQETLLHELTHAATYWGLRTPELDAAGDLLVQDVKRQVPMSQFELYSLGNADELVAFAFTNAEARAKLGTLRISDATAEALGLEPDVSLFQALVDWIAKKLGFEPTDRNIQIVEAVALLGHRAMAANDRGRGGRADPEGQLYRIANPEFKEGIAQRARDAATNASPRALRGLLSLSSTTDIASMWGKLFSWSGDGVRRYLQLDRQRNPLEQLENAYARRAAKTRDIEKQLMPELEVLANHRANNPKEAAALGELLDEATTWQIDPANPNPPGSAGEGKTAWQRLQKARYDNLRARYLALSPAGKDAVARVKSMLASQQEGATRDIARAYLLTRWQQAQLDRRKVGDPMPAGFPETADERTVGPAVARLMAGEPTAEDRLWAGDTGMDMIDTFRANMRTPGFYSPKARFGDWVVYGRRTDFDKENIVDSEAEAEALAQRIEASGGLVTRIGKRTYAPDGTHVQSRDRGDRADLTEKWLVQAQPQVMETFDSRAEAEARRAELARDGNLDLRTVEPREASFANLVQELDAAQSEKITRAIRSVTADEAQQAELLSAFREAAVRLLPGNNIRHSLLKRRNVLGASTDHIRSMSRFVNTTARYRAGLQFRPYEFAAQQAMNDNRRATDDGLNVKRLPIIDEMKKRSNAGDASTQGRGSFMQAVSRYTAVHFLFSPSYTIMQLLQPALMGPPVLAKLNPNTAMGDIIAAMTSAHSDIGGASNVVATGVANAKRSVARGRARATEGVVDMLAGVKLQVKQSGARDADEIAGVLDQLALRGRIDEHAGIEVARNVGVEGGKFAKGFRTVEELSRAFPAAAEVYNRSLMATAAYRLAKSQGKTAEQAFFAAEQAVIDSQFVYNPENTPSLMNEVMNSKAGQFLVPFMIFKKFVQAMYMQIGRSFYDSIAGETPEVKRAARRQFGYMMASHAAVAGGLGLPLEPIKLALGAAAILAGDDEPWDFDDRVTEAANAVFGKEVAEVVTRGLPRAVNLDLSSRIGLDSMLAMKDLENFEPKTAWAYFGELMAGAPGGIVSGALRSMQHFRETGDPAKIVSAVAPKLIRDPVSAWAIATDGMTDGKGTRIDEGALGAADAIFKAIGFQSGTMAKIYEHRQKAFRDDKATRRDRSRLHREAAALDKAGDKAGRAALQKEIDAFNASHPAHVQITDKSIARSAASRSRYVDPDKTYFGVPLRKGQQPSSIFNLPGKGYTSTPAPSPRAASPDLPAEGSNESQFFTAVIQAEGTALRGDPYNEVLGYGAYGRPSKPLTQMTLREVYDFGQRVIRPRHRADRGGPGSSAMGAFQIVGSTLKQYMREAGLGWDDEFTPENQRRLAAVIYRNQGLQAWEGFKKAPRQRMLAARAAKTLEA